VDLEAAVVEVVAAAVDSGEAVVVADSVAAAEEGVHPR
jgi:predicted RecA/RadA family phage recombinase